MEILTIGELKTHFSDVLNRLRDGQEIVISYGKKREKVAVLVPYSIYMEKPERKLGALKHKGSFIMHDDFRLDDEDFLSS